MHNDIQFCFTCLRDQFWSQTLDGLTLGAIYALIALGYTLVYGVLKLINFAHSEIFMIGVFASLFTLHGLGMEPADPSNGCLLRGSVPPRLRCLLRPLAPAGCLPAEFAPGRGDVAEGHVDVQVLLDPAGRNQRRHHR